MKKTVLLLLCAVLMVLLASCDEPLPPDASSEPSSSAADTAAPDFSVSAPASQPGSEPNSEPGSVSGSEPDSNPDTNPNPVPDPTPNTDTGSSDPDFLEDFMAAHNAGKKYTVSFEDDTYEISLNADTGKCTVLHKKRAYDEYLRLTGDVFYPLGKYMAVYYNYYYMGTAQPAADGSFTLCFSQYHVELVSGQFSASTVADIRKCAWDNIYKSKWQEIYLTQAECEFWDDLLDGKTVKDVRRYQEKLELKGNVSLPLQLMYFDPNGEKTHSVSVDKEKITNTTYSGESYEYREYDLNGKLLTWGGDYGNGAHWRREYDSKEQLVFDGNYSADGSYSETTFVRDNGILTKTTLRYKVDKADGLYCEERLVDVYRYDSDNPEKETPVSSHTYDRDKSLVKFFLYDEQGRRTETFYYEMAGRPIHTLYTYEGDKLAKTVATDVDNIITTTEYIYENGKLVRQRITVLHPNGDKEQWDEESGAAAPSSQ